MGTVDVGQQKISFDYNSAAHSELINEILHKTIPIGIKQGMVLSKYSASEIQITDELAGVQHTMVFKNGLLTAHTTIG